MNRKQFLQLAKWTPFLALMIGGLLPAVYAGDPEFKTELSASSLQMGETAILQITATWRKGTDSFSFTTPAPRLENLKILRSGESQETLIKDGQAWSVKIFEIEFAPEKHGQGIIRAFTLNYLKRSEDSDAATPPPLDFYRIPEYRIEITSAPVSGMLMLLAAGAGLLFFLGRVWFLIKQRRKISTTDSSPSGEDKTIQEIQTLISSLTKSELKDTTFKIAVHFRDFLIRRFQLKWKAYSEIELIESLKAQGVEDPDLFRLLARLHDTKYAAGRVDRLALRQLGEGMVATIQGMKIVGRPSLSS